MKIRKITDTLSARIYFFWRIFLMKYLVIFIAFGICAAWATAQETVYYGGYDGSRAEANAIQAERNQLIRYQIQRDEYNRMVDKTESYRAQRQQEADAYYDAQQQRIDNMTREPSDFFTDLN